MATIRRQVRIDRTADDVWSVVGDPATIAGWFPGVVSATVEGARRTITTQSGVTLPEDIVTVDPLQRRFQYRLQSPLTKSHLATIDVFDLEDGTSLVSYGTDCEPDIAALIIGGATGSALRELKRQLESSPTRADHERPEH